MKILICCSISAAREALLLKGLLEGIGHSVDIPEAILNESQSAHLERSNLEKGDEKVRRNLIRRSYETIMRQDAVLVVNPERQGIDGYIGANTLIEMAFAHVLGKKVFVLNALPDLPYTPELLATQPVVLSGHLERLI